MKIEENSPLEVEKRKYSYHSVNAKTDDKMATVNILKTLFFCLIKFHNSISLLASRIIIYTNTLPSHFQTKGNFHDDIGFFVFFNKRNIREFVNG
jgi:hypothetical protein